MLFCCLIASDFGQDTLYAWQDNQACLAACFELLSACLGISQVPWSVDQRTFDDVCLEFDDQRVQPLLLMDLKFGRFEQSGPHTSDASGNHIFMLSFVRMPCCSA